MAKKLKVTLIRSGINRPEATETDHLATGPAQDGAQRSLAGQSGRARMIRSVAHLVKVEVAE